jgi:acyl-CoA thioesterase-1
LILHKLRFPRWSERKFFDHILRLIAMMTWPDLRSREMGGMQSILLLIPIVSVILATGSIAAPPPVAPPAAADLPPRSADQTAWEESVYPKYKTWPAMRYVEEKPNLPRVLLIGDSISIGYTTRTQDALAGQANVLRIPENAGSTRDGLEKIDRWLARRPHWDVIHFNFGLHDLKKQKSGSPNPDQLDVTGAVNIPLAEYEANLEALVQRLKQTGARLIWASTTPIPEGSPGRVRGDEVAYNEAARRVMEKNGVRINDLHACVQPSEAASFPPGDVHPNDPGKEILARQTAAEISQALKTP